MGPRSWLRSPGTTAKCERSDESNTSMKPALLSAWQTWALLSACFAALTAIFAKVGVENISPDLATFIRTIVVLLAFSVLLFFTGQFSVPSAVASKTWLFLVLSGLATGASWLCYFRALKLGPATLVAPIDKLSVVPGGVVRLRVSRRASDRAGLARHRHDRRRRRAAGGEVLRRNKAGVRSVSAGVIAPRSRNRCRTSAPI